MTKRILNIALLAVAITANLVMIVYGLANASAAGDMLGVVVKEGNASFEAADQPGAAATLEIDEVVVPGPSWVVVHLDMDGKPGERVGLAHVDGGKTGSVKVSLKTGATLTEKVLVALHADRGIVDTFEFDMDKFETSPDKPYFVDGKELAKAVAVK